MSPTAGEKRREKTFENFADKELELREALSTWVVKWNGMESHGGLEVTIRQTESKKKTTQQLRETDP